MQYIPTGGRAILTKLGRGCYHLVFNNGCSTVSNKAVNARVELALSRRAELAGSGTGGAKVEERNCVPQWTDRAIAIR